MTDGSSELNDGKSNPVDTNKGDPRPIDTFAINVAKIRQGKAHELTFLETDLERLKNLEAGIITPFIEKGRELLNKAINTALIPDMDEDEKLNTLNDSFNIHVKKVGEGTYSTTPINIQILNLGALVYAGESEQVRRHQMIVDPKTTEDENVSLILRKTDAIALSDNERNLLLSLATGIEIGYGPEAGNKLDRVTRALQNQLSSRSNVPESLGDDYIEALLSTPL